MTYIDGLKHAKDIFRVASRGPHIWHGCCCFLCRIDEEIAVELEKARIGEHPDEPQPTMPIT